MNIYIIVKIPEMFEIIMYSSSTNASGCTIRVNTMAVWSVEQGDISRHVITYEVAIVI